MRFAPPQVLQSANVEMPIFFDGEVFGESLQSAIRQAPDAVVLQCIEPHAAAQPEDGGDLPLHVALRHRRSEQIVTSLAAAHPAAVEAPGRDARLPLHLACMLHANARAQKLEVRLDHTPNQWVTVVRVLLEAHPAAVSLPDGLGRLPLHHAAARRAPLELLQHVCDAHPQAASLADVAGDTPLHLLAAQHDQSERSK